MMVNQHDIELKIFNALSLCNVVNIDKEIF